MDPGSSLLSVCAMVLCLLGAARASTNTNTCPCADIPPVRLTLPPPNTSCNSTFRYTCIHGYVRRVGHSNLIRCKEENGVMRWSDPKLICIRDPTMPTIPPSSPPPSPTPSTLPPTSSPTSSSTSSSTSPPQPESPDSLRTTGYADVLQESSVTPTNSVTSSSQPTTSSGGSWTSEATEISSAEPTSPTEQSQTSQDYVTVAEAKGRTTSSPSTADPFSSTTVDPHKSRQTEQNAGSISAAIVIAIVVIACAIIGVLYYMRRRKSRPNSPMGTLEEGIAMNAKDES